MYFFLICHWNKCYTSIRGIIISPFLLYGLYILGNKFLKSLTRVPKPACYRHFPTTTPATILSNHLYVDKFAANPSMEEKTRIVARIIAAK